MTQAFFGRYTCPLDEKNRAVVPLKLRESIAPDLLRDGFVLTMGFEGCLMLFARDRWRELVASIEKLSLTDPKARQFKRFFFSSAQEVPIDRVGRITIADFQKEISGVEREVVFNGMGDHVEVWSPDRWKAYSEEKSGEYGEVAASLLLGDLGPAAGGSGSADGAP